MSQHEYRTTQVIIQPGQEIPDPVQPEGEGWELIHQMPTKIGDQPIWVWTWRRPKLTQSGPVEEELRQA